MSETSRPTLPFVGQRSCGQCASVVRILDRFCPQCGASLRALSLRLQGVEPDRLLPGPSPGERRQVTVLFCDLVGSTSLSTRTDPEKTRHVMQVYQAVCAQIIVRYGGHIAQTLGDGLMVYFGYPRAHEDDALRAVHAGLEITACVADARGSLRLAWNAGAVRVGISTGVVVVGPFSEWDTRAAMAVVGETPNLASRLQHLADRNEVILGPETKRLVDGHFHFEARGPFEIAGFPAPLQVYRALEKSAPPTRFRARQTSTPPKMVGRDGELARLLECWQRACAGGAQAAVISGPAGVGKSRLAHALATIGQREHAFVLYAQCSAYFANTALYPVARQLRRTASIRASDSPGVAYGKLQRILKHPDPAPERDIVLLAQLLQIAGPDDLAVAAGAPERLLADTVEALVRRIQQLASRRAVMILLEDAHWVDPTTLKLVQKLLRVARRERILLVITDRDDPGTRAHGPSEVLTQLPLDVLNPDACRALVHNIASGALVDSLADDIVTRSAGLPLYAEELTKSLLESPSRGKSGVPISLQALLTERIDRIGPHKIIAQVAACIGRSFERALIARVVDVDADALDGCLERLVADGILSQESCDGIPSYAFRHPLLQTAAYEALLFEERRELHGAIGDVLLRDELELCEREPETVARHLDCAANDSLATLYWIRAAELAQRRSAHVEAIAHLRAGLACIARRRAALCREELDFQDALARSHMASEGWPGRRVGRAYERARELARSIRDKTKECEITWGLWVNRATAGQLVEAKQIAEDSIALAREHGERALLAMAHTAALMTRFWLGDYAHAESHAGEIDLIYRSDEHRDLVQRYNHDPLVTARAFQGHYYWLAGEELRARRAATSAIDHARRLGHPFQLCFVLVNGSSAFWRGAEQACRFHDEALALAAQQRIPLFRHHGALHAARALVQRDPSPETLRWLRECLDHVRSWAGDHAVNIPLFTLNVAWAHARLGQWHEAQALLTQAFHCIEHNEERWIEPEAHRVHAWLLLEASADADAAQNALRRGLELARAQKAVGLELRIACDLCELLLLHGKPPDAREAFERACNAQRPAHDPDCRERLKRVGVALGVPARDSDTPRVDR